MADENYLYIGVGIITMIVVAGIAAIEYPSLSADEGVTILLSEKNSPQNSNYWSNSSKDQLFSENGTTLNFSRMSMINFSQQEFECKISCRGTE
jgi:hypothetical protein